MGAIVSYVGVREAVPVLLQALAHVRDQRYDSVGVAVRDPDGYFNTVKTVGRVDVLAGALSEEPPLGHMGLGHTRWRTHGAITTENAQPHTDCHGLLAVVGNGIVENHVELKLGLRARGHRFLSMTDAEVIPHLIEEELLIGGAETNLEEAVRSALRRTEGTLAIVAARAEEPETLVAARRGYASPLVAGWAHNEAFVTNEAGPLTTVADRIAFLAADEVAIITPRGVEFKTLMAGVPIAKRSISPSEDPLAAARGGHMTFMIKEITEQPEAWTDAMRGRIDFGTLSLTMDELEPIRDALRNVERVVLAGSSSSLHAAQTGRLAIEELTDLPCQVDVGSQILFGDFQLGPETLFIAVTQSGETLDTLGVLSRASERGSPTIIVTNEEESTGALIADAVVPLRSGRESGMASTKSFTSSVLNLYLIALHLAQIRSQEGADSVPSRLNDLARLAGYVNHILEDPAVLAALATRYSNRRDALFLAQGRLYPIAAEGAWKLIQLGYIHAQVFPGSELLHGPIALINGDETPVFAIAPQGPEYGRMALAIRLVKENGGVVAAILTEGDDELASIVDHPIFIPSDTPEPLLPLVTSVPLQLFAYYAGIQKGNAVDEPRNIRRIEDFTQT